MLLSDFRSQVAALRFCPMLAPAGEVAAVSECDGHTLRARSVMLWRALERGCALDGRSTELLFQSTLDSISQAYDPYHAPVWQIMRAARTDAVATGGVPEPVAGALDELAKFAAPSVPQAKRIMLLGEIVLFGGDASHGKSLAEALRVAGHGDVEAWPALTGATALAFGDRELARRQAEAIAGGLANSVVEEVICDSPETFWALSSMFADLEVKLPDTIQVSLFSRLLADSGVAPEKSNRTVYVHDSRASYLLRQGEADSVTLEPGFRWQPGAKEELCGFGAVYEHVRVVADTAYDRREWDLWTRGLAKSCGSDDGLWMSYPEIARKLALARLDEAVELQADVIVTDSPLAAWWLAKNRQPRHPAVAWLPELFGN
ncbi:MULTISPECIES: hypothetical protein [unclassified Mesorhizobium]|uniref:hypothetical protein n=1 Tax=unclassified Mesorhizobium TaxID=325217 RepID=UPI000FDB113B|nr:MULTISPECIES: hypothetical protein [unclassified Mesorhizobium]TGT71921.1 hypothetical protein EN809_017315 [Mesorhizobium sp. M2E.F.Ca.ET.166.01.1.1]TGV99364.1 hypothetical protein EN797_023940 [Mesorhizobium sp. M2E.F.Ca.ET.154.01.1.1]